MQTREFDEAYSRICSDARGRLSLEEFSNGGAHEFAPPIGLETLVGVEVDAREDLATEGDEVVSSVVLVEGSTGAVTQRWRANLVKDDGWKVCSFTLDSERLRSSTTPGSFEGSR